MGTEDGADFFGRAEGGGCASQSQLLPGWECPKSRQTFPALAPQHPNLCQMTFFFFFWHVINLSGSPSPSPRLPRNTLNIQGMKTGGSQQQQDEASLLNSFPRTWLCLGDTIPGECGILGSPCSWDLPAPDAAERPSASPRQNRESKLP